MPRITLTTFASLLPAALFSATAANAQSRILPDPDPTRLANAPADAEPQHDWQFRLGAGLLYAPAFVGSDQL